MSSTTGAATTKKEPVKPAAVVEKKDTEEEEFEEFPVQEWPERRDGDDEEVNVWEDNWDDETHESEFSKQLKEELAKSGHPVA